MWQTVIDAEHKQLEAQELLYKKKYERFAFWISTLVPGITTVILAGTLIFSIEQFRASSDLQRNANEDTQWREIVKSLKVSPGDPFEGIKTPILLKSFLNGRYKQPARELSIELLGGAAYADMFQGGLFSSIIDQTDLHNVNDLATLSRRLEDYYHHNHDLIEQGETRKANTQAELNTAKQDLKNIDVGKTVMHIPVSSVSGVAPSPRQYYEERVQQLQGMLDSTSTTLNKEYSVRDDLTYEEHIVADAVIDVLQRPRSREDRDFVPDLHGLIFEHTDLSNKHLSKTNLRAALFINVNLSNTHMDNVANVQDARFVQVTDWHGSDWTGTKWWKAQFIDKDLLDFLKDKFPNTSAIDAKQYTEDVTRLEEELKQQK